jgi:hypothetical protein
MEVSRKTGTGGNILGDSGKRGCCIRTGDCSNGERFDVAPQLRSSDSRTSSELSAWC